MCDQLSVRMIAGNESDSVAFGISSQESRSSRSYPRLIGYTGGTNFLTFSHRFVIRKTSEMSRDIREPGSHVDTFCQRHPHLFSSKIYPLIAYRLNIHPPSLIVMVV